MTTSGAFENYLKFIADWISGVVAPKGEIFDAESYTQYELKLIDDVFRRFTEITDAIDNLDLCLDFISARAPRKKGLKLDSYIIYHITFYIQEIYILNKRLESYAKVIMRRKKRLGKPVPD